MSNTFLFCFKNVCKNGPQYYVIRTLPVLFFLGMVTYQYLTDIVSLVHVSPTLVTIHRRHIVFVI